MAAPIGGTTCWMCGAEPNDQNFGGLCDSCDQRRKQRLVRAAQILDRHGISNREADVVRFVALRHA